MVIDYGSVCLLDIRLNLLSLSHFQNDLSMELVMISNNTVCNDKWLLVHTLRKNFHLQGIRGGVSRLQVLDLPCCHQVSFKMFYQRSWLWSFERLLIVVIGYKFKTWTRALVTWTQTSPWPSRVSVFLLDVGFSLYVQSLLKWLVVEVVNIFHNTAYNDLGQVLGTNFTLNVLRKAPM